MEIPTYLLFLLGWLGAADILLFHSIAHGIRCHPDSAGELLTHSLRGPTYATFFLIIPNCAAHGVFAWALLVLFAIDVGISIWDFSLEGNSRRLLGGLPTGEYVLHMLMALVFGGLLTSFIYCGRDWFSAPTRLAYVPAGVPGVVRVVMFAMAILVLTSGVQDVVAALRLCRVARQPNVHSVDSPELGLLHESLIRENAVLTRGPSISSSEEPQPAAWMGTTLAAAGIYNLLWTAWVVLLPADFFRLAGMAPINYPPIWQCVGMLVGVYGIGYLLAAQDPFRHWPIVLVGLLGKMLGPIGMGWSIASGALPARMAWICVANDLIWWVPFALILGRALTLHRAKLSNLRSPRTI